MKFGELSLDRAKGAILAHSIAIPGGRLRKGHVLQDADIAALAGTGLDRVTAALLEPGDVDENTAAARLVEAVGGRARGLRIPKAFTGRANLVAEGPGVVRLDEAAVHAVNAVHPMITIATVPPFHQMAEGGMVATVKIISYAVAEADLEEACRRGQDAISFAAPVLQRATLIISEVEKGAGDKGRDAIEGRLAALDVALDETVMVPHETEAIASAIKAAGSDLVLILTGSATSDIEDVAPAALRAAGGTLTHFGMPVDPGNLLFLGALGTTPVIGLPGCARSPALNGADWVLSRIVCGVPVKAGDIMAMGVGGLLKEIPTRPQPRRGR